MLLFFISVIFLFISIFLFTKTKEKVNNNNKLEKEEEEIKNKIKKFELSCKEKQATENLLTEKINFLNKTIEANKEIMENALSQYSDLLETNYKEEEKIHDDAIDTMRYAYNLEQDKLMEETAKIQKDLDKIRSTRAAAIEANKKEEQIKADLSYYCVIPTQEELDDIQALERIKPKLHQPRILCMLIWSTYFQKPMTTLCNNILGLNEITGVYKITNQKTNQCYIGQAVDVAKRWKDHAKCGLGIDTPVNNKLYQAIFEYGLWNFSFELLEKCSKDLLDEKESFYINLYQSKEYGYNSTSGNKK